MLAHRSSFGMGEEVAPIIRQDRSVTSSVRLVCKHNNVFSQAQSLSLLWDTDEHGSAQPQPKSLTAETQRTRRFRPWERTLRASSVAGCLTPCTQDAGCVRSRDGISAFSAVRFFLVAAEPFCETSKPRSFCWAESQTTSWVRPGF